MSNYCGEYWFSITPPPGFSAAESAVMLENAYVQALSERALTEADVVFKRYFCSDVYRYAPLLQRHEKEHPAGLTLYIGQAPLDTSFCSLQVYAVRGNSSSTDGDEMLRVKHGGYESLWSIVQPTGQADAEAQSDEAIEKLCHQLTSKGMSLAEDVIRTWYYVRDIDNNYAGMIKSRTRHYEACGLTANTHFIASTGIEGKSTRPSALVTLVTHAIQGLQKSQIRYLKALANMSPTHAYGVNFERATCITYGDRKHIHISGTASIDDKGKVLHCGDIVRQCHRALDNIEALLHEGSLGVGDLCAAVVYLRDGQEYPQIAPVLKERLPRDCAVNVTEAPVCRPDWLVEIEGEAIAPHCAPFPNFLSTP